MPLSDADCLRFATVAVLLWFPDSREVVDRLKQMTAAADKAAKED